MKQVTQELKKHVTEQDQYDPIHIFKRKKDIRIWSQMICESIDNEMLMTSIHEKGGGGEQEELMFPLYPHARKWKQRENRVVCYGRPILTTSVICPACICFQPLVLPGLQLASCRCSLTVHSVHSWVSGSSGHPAGLSNQLCIGVANLNTSGIFVRLFPLLCFTFPVHPWLLLPGSES